MRPEQLEDGGRGSILGNTAQVTFAQFGDRSIEGKVDTGATTSSLHAERMTINQQQGTVTFFCKALSNNMITLELDGAQEVHSADAGGNTRPVVKLDVSIDGTPIQGAQFNLNDRGEMDSEILIGQNILKAGKFMIDPTKEESPQANTQMSPEDIQRETQVLAAIEVLAEHDISLRDIITYLQTVAVNKIKD